MRHHMGRVEVICGSMFCGKTEELIRRVRRAIIAKQTVQVFKPNLDIRYGIEAITSHDGRRIEARPINTPDEICGQLDSATTVVAVDEVQFLERGIVALANTLADRGLRVILAGLDLDFRGEPFGPMPELLCIAEEVTKLHAICVICGEQASRTQRLINGEPAHYNDPTILVGAREVYEARCRHHHAVRQD
ncbi:MAG: thymidine kinase [Chloroflexi bacterium]|nr:thymidine kinase [Chloroflexota bacterium]